VSEVDEYTRLYVEARVRLAIGATLAAFLLLVSLAMPWVSIGGENALVWESRTS
jgi:hypothetical protein